MKACDRIMKISLFIRAHDFLRSNFVNWNSWRKCIFEFICFGTKFFLVRVAPLYLYEKVLIGRTKTEPLNVRTKFLFTYSIFYILKLVLLFNDISLWSSLYPHQKGAKTIFNSPAVIHIHLLIFHTQLIRCTLFKFIHTHYHCYIHRHHSMSVLCVGLVFIDFLLSRTRRALCHSLRVYEYNAANEYRIKV